MNELLKRGIINQEEASHHPKRNVLVQAIGIKEALRISFIRLKKIIVQYCSVQMDYIIHSHLNRLKIS